MTEPLECEVARDMASEVAIGVASAEDRARLLHHVGTCADCSTFLAELSDVVDGIVALTPSIEPPGGFESGVLSRLTGPGPAPIVRRATGASKRRWRWAAQAAVVLVAAGVAGGVVYRLGTADRRLADAIRATLATSNGEYFAAAPLLDPEGGRRGVLFAYQGDPSWVFLTVEAAASAAPVTIELVTLDGAVHTLGDGVDLAAETPFGTVIPVAVHEVAMVRVLDGDGQPLMTARLVP